mmetsp:Transcript_79213/g.164410  ORF Transcript_79213/g.164410 Transcript_79213/m.164410 type:complete len:360 (+) Transcript_79213:429-1508(+)
MEIYRARTLCTSLHHGFDEARDEDDHEGQKPEQHRGNVLVGNLMTHPDDAWTPPDSCEEGGDGEGSCRTPQEAQTSRATASPVALLQQPSGAEEPAGNPDCHRQEDQSDEKCQVCRNGEVREWNRNLLGACHWEFKLPKSDELDAVRGLRIEEKSHQNPEHSNSADHPTNDSQLCVSIHLELQVEDTTFEAFPMHSMHQSEEDGGQDNNDGHNDTHAEGDHQEAHTECIPVAPRKRESHPPVSCHAHGAEMARLEELQACRDECCIHGVFQQQLARCLKSLLTNHLKCRCSIFLRELARVGDDLLQDRVLGGREEAEQRDQEGVEEQVEEVGPKLGRFCPRPKMRLRNIADAIYHSGQE